MFPILAHIVHPQIQPGGAIRNKSGVAIRHRLGQGRVVKVEGDGVVGHGDGDWLIG